MHKKIKTFGFTSAAAVAALLILAGITGGDILELVGTKARMPRFVFFLNRDAERAMRIGEYYFNGGAYDLTKAKHAYEQALILQPDRQWAHYQIARIHFLRGYFNQALAEINQELAAHPDNLRSLYIRGLIYGYRGNFDKAEEDFRGFISWSPNEWAGYNDLTWIQATRGKFAEVKKTVGAVFERLPDEKDKNPWLWTNLGVAHLNLKEYNESKKALQRALAITERMSAEDFWNAYPGNNPLGAENGFRQFLATLHFNLGVVYEKLGEAEKAKEEYNAYLTMLPDGPFPGRKKVEERIKKLNESLE